LCSASRRCTGLDSDLSAGRSCRIRIHSVEQTVTTWRPRSSRGRLVFRAPSRPPSSLRAATEAMGSVGDFRRQRVSRCLRQCCHVPCLQTINRSNTGAMCTSYSDVAGTGPFPRCGAPVASRACTTDRSGQVSALCHFEIHPPKTCTPPTPPDQGVDEVGCRCSYHACEQVCTYIPSTNKAHLG
jgi:hypothetical protein